MKSAVGCKRRCKLDGGLCGVGGFCNDCHAISGQQLKRHGQQRALDNAGTEWISQARYLLRLFLGQRKHSKARAFTLETFRAYCVLNGLSPPASHKVWGSIPQIAVRAGLIEFTGRYVNASSPKTRAHPVRVWQAL